MNSSDVMKKIRNLVKTAFNAGRRYEIESQIVDEDRKAQIDSLIIGFFGDEKITNESEVK